jgi:hypothetical protein
MVKEGVKLLTTNDVVVVWGGTRDVGRNETTRGLNQLKDFFKKNNHTNIIQMCVPQRYDLYANSCVNKEAEVFNRKLGKLVKAFKHTALIKLDLNRELFTKHGLHMNGKGKELVAKKIMSTIKHMLRKQIEEPICMTWKEDEVKKSQEKQKNHIYEEERTSLESNEGRVNTQECTAFQKDRCQEVKQDGTTTISSRRLRKPPTTRRDDFLWMDRRQEKPPTKREEDFVC